MTFISILTGIFVRITQSDEYVKSNIWPIYPENKMLLQLNLRAATFILANEIHYSNYYSTLCSGKLLIDFDRFYRLIPMFYR